MTIPKEVLDQLLGSVRVEWDANGNWTSIRMPRVKSLVNLYHECGGTNRGISLDEVAEELEAAMWKALPHWRLAELKRARARGAMQVTQPLAPEPKRLAAGLEARIKELKMTDVMKWCKVNGLQLQIHPTNNGLTAMRGRNMLQGLLRRTGTIKEG